MKFALALLLFSLQLPASTLVAAYSFGEGSGTVVSDSSGNGNTGTISNATWTAAGKYGNALVFNGSNALLTIADAASLHLTGGMTLEAWVNPLAVTGSWRDVVYKGDDNYYLSATSSKSTLPAGGGKFGSSTSETYGTTALTPNAWTHLAVTYDGAILRLYVNGTQVSSRAQTGNLATSTNPLQIGGDSIYGQYFSGTIDEVRVYNVALTTAQIQADMSTPISPGCICSAHHNAVLQWTASTTTDVTKYNIYRCNGGTCSPNTLIGSVNAPTAKFTDGNVSAGATYSWAVTAIDPAGESVRSNVTTSTIPTP